MLALSRSAFAILTFFAINLSHAQDVSVKAAGSAHNQISQVVSFGDSLSDVGTYAYAKKFDGGTYTTNPGLISVEHIAEHYGTYIRPALTGGFGQASVLHPEGLGYAQGGARIAGSPNPGDATGDTGELQTPLTAQVAAYLGMHKRFNAQQLVLMQGGANDVQDAFNTWDAMVANGGDPSAALSGVTPSLQQAAQQLAGLVHNVVQHGATHVVLQNVPDISKAPIADQAEQQLPGSSKVLKRLAQIFNEAMDDALSSSPAVLRIDAFAFLDETSAAYRTLGFRFDGSKGTNMACGAAKLPTPWQADATSALFCSPATYVTPKADQLYMFADAYHPSTHLQKLIAEYVEGRVDRWLEGQQH